MATEEEAREATDGKEVQVEAVDLGTVQMLMHPEGKLSSTMEIKSMGEIVDSTEGTLKIPEDQVLVEVPSEVKLPTEHNLNGTSSSLNGHMDKEEKVSNEQLHDNNQEEAELDETSTDQNNRINKEEVTDCVSHGESTTEDSCLLKHQKEEPKGEDRQDLEGVTVGDDKVQGDTLKTENAVERIVDGQQDQNLEPAKATEDIQPASMANTPDVEVVAEAPAGVQTPVQPNLDDSDAISDDIDGNTEIDEPAKEDGFIHLDHKESIPEDTSIAEYTDEAVKVEYQLNKQGDVMDAEVVQEEIPKCEETDVQEEMPKPEHADESTTAAQEVLNQESAEETNGLVNEKTVETAHQSNIAASEPQVAEIAEELKDIEKIETQEIIQQGHVTPSKEPSAEDDSTASEPNYVIQQTLEQDPVEVKDTETHHERTISASEDTVEDNVTAEGPTYDSEEVENVESTEEIKENITEIIAEVSNVAIVYEVDEEKKVLRAEDISEKHMRGLEPEETKNTEPVETEEVSDQRQAALLNDSAQKHNTPPSEKQQMESAIEMNETEATKTEAIPQESNACVFEEPSTEDYITESQTNCDTQEASITESSEVIEGDKDIKTGEISDQSIIVFAGESAQENNAPESEPTADIQLVQEPESEDLKNTKLVEVNKASHEMNATVFQTPTQEDNPTTIELHAIESAGEVSNTKATEEEGIPHQSNADQSEERPTEENETASEPQILEPESVEETNDIEATEPQSISQQSIISTSEESVPEETVTEDNRTTEPDVDHQLRDQESAQFMEIEALADHAVQDKIQPSEPTADIQPVQELEQTETKSTRTCEMDEASDQTHAVVFNDLAQEDGIAASEPQVTQIAEEQKDIEATETQEITQHGHVTPSKELPAEDAVKDTETHHEKTICTSEEDTVEDNVTAEGPTCDSHKVDNVESTEETKENIAESIAEVSNVAIVDTQEVSITESSEVIEGDKDIKTGEISDQSIIVLAGESAQENSVPESEPTADIQLVQEPESEDLKNTKLVEVNKTFHEMNATVFQTPTQEDNPTTIELHAMESAGEVSNTDATEAEGTPHQSNADQSEERSTEENNTASEPQILEPESVEETNDIEATEPQSISQQSIISTSEESVPEETAAENNITTEPDVDHQLRDQESVQFMEIEALVEHAVQDKIQPSEPTADIQPVQELEQTETKSTRTCEMDEASDQTHAVVFNDLAQEDGIAASEPQVTQIAEEQKDIEATETQEITQHGHVTPSKELPAENAVKDTETPHEKTICTSEEVTMEDNVAAEGQTCDSHKVDNVQSTEEIKESIAESIAEVPHAAIVDKSNEEKNVLRAEDISEKHTRGIEPEETKNTEPVETEEDSDQRHAALFDDSAQEDNTPASEKQHTESALEIKEIAASKTEAIPQETNACVSEEPSPEDNITESETTCDTQEVNTTESSKAIGGDKDTETEEVSDQSNMDFAGESTQENNVPESEPIADIESVQEAESEEMKNTELVEGNETSHEMNAAVFQKPTQEDNPTTSKLHVMESAGEVSNIEATEAQATPHQSNSDQSEEQATEENKTASETQILEAESVKEMNDTEVSKPQSISQQSIITTSEESVSEEIAKEDTVTIEPNVDHPQIQDQESAKFKEIEAPLGANKPQGITSSCTVSTSEESTSEDNATATETSSDTQAEILQSSEVTEDTENAKIAEEVAPEEHVETEDTADISPVQEPEEETKNTEPVGTEDNMTSRDLPAEEMVMETMETEAIPHESPVASIKELTEYDILTANAPHADIQPVLELESVEAAKCTDTTEHPGELQKIIGSASDKLTPTEEKITVTEPAFDTQQVQNLTSQEIKDSEDAKTDEISDLSSFPTLEEADQESNVPRIEPTSDVQQVQELDPKEETRSIKAVETEDHQQYRVSTLEEPAVDSEPNVDDQQMHEDKPAEVKDNEAMEAEEVIKQSNISTPDNAAEERSELGSDLEFYVQPAQQVELSRDSEDSELVKAEETSGQSNIVALEETTTEDSVAIEINPPVDIKQEHEQESLEEIKCIDATEAEEDFHTSQADAIEKLIEPSYDIQLVNDLERNKEMKGIQAMDDGEQTDIATLEDPSTTDNGTKPEEHPVELNEHNMGNETDNEMLVHGIKDKIQTSTELKDTECDLGETVLTPPKSENTTDEDDVQSSSDDTLETPKDIHQVKEEQKAGTEHNSSQMSQHGEHITHVQDRDIKREFLTKKGTAEASQAFFESDPQVAQEVTEKDDTIKGGEQTNDHDNRQLGGVVLQLQTCETDALSIVKQDEAAQKVDLDQQQKEDEIESQKELQVDEQKYEEKTDDFTTEPLVEPQNIENGTTNRTEDTDAFKAEQTEADITEILRHEQAPHISEESTPSITYMKVENVKGTNEEAEEDADAKNDSKDEQENAEKDKVVAKDSTDEKDETTDENTNDELEPGLASSVQEISDPAPSNDEILKKDHIAVPQNVESRVHREDKECTNKVNDDVHAIQASDKEIIDEVEENKEMQNEDNDGHHDESQTKPEEKESPQLRFNQPYNTDTKIDNTTTPWEEIIHDKTSIQPREIEEIGENKGLDSISTPFVETSIQNNVEQDLSSHQKVEDEKLSTTEQKAVDIEAMEEKVDESASDTSQTRQCKEDINADDVLQLETEENAFDKIDETALNKKTETSNTTSTEVVKINEDITDKASGANGALSDESLKTFNDTGRDLDISSVITASKEESMNENMEDHKLPLPAQVEKETEREMSLSEKLLHTEPEEQDENQTPNEQDDDGIQETEIGDAKKEVEQELPVSHFLMNLILGKENGDANGNSESEAERKQEETTEDNSCLIISKQDESLVSLPTEIKVDDKLTFKQEKHDVKCSEETQEMVKEQSHDLKLDTGRSIETDEELNKNTRDLETPAYQDNSQDEISGEMFSEEAASIATKMETRDIEISNIELDDSVVDTICQENSEASTTIENGSSTNNLNNLTNTKASEEDTLGEGQTGLLREFLPKEISADAVSEQALLLTESGMTDAKDLPSDAESIQNPVCAKQDEPTESSNIEATSTPDIQLESKEVDKKEEKQNASTATCEVSEEHVESLHDSLQKSTSSEATSDEKEPQITKPVSDTEMTLAHEKEISEGSTCMNEKEKSNFSIKGLENFQTAVEAQANGPKIQINHDKQDEAAENETAMEPERLGESNFQEHQESGTEQKSPKESDGDQQFLVKKETVIKQEDVHETVESHTQTLSITSNEEQEMLESKVQERDLIMISPKEAPDAEEKFVDITKPEFSTDEAMKTEARGAGQKVAHKKHNLLSGVGSKVKHQLAKVKKAIIGKPGQTKPESLKS